MTAEIHMSYCTNWCKTAADIQYHDTEWGRPVHEDQKLFEYLMLEVLQGGLSWRLILQKRAVFQHCFEQFNYDKIARYTQKDITRILHTPHMIASVRKIKAIIQNAKAFCTLRQEFGTFNQFIWEFCGGQAIVYRTHPKGNVPVSNGLSSRLSVELKKRGFTFLGPVTVYSYLQACGIINDHSVDCPLFKQIKQQYPTCYKTSDEEKFA